MTTTTLHSDVQRSRFFHHLLAALTTPAWALLRLPFKVLPPAPTPAERASREAQRVRELAYGHRTTDPGFAADLYAAAARHETLHGG